MRSGDATPHSHDDRHLDWDGCVNVRDLGGLATVDGRRTRHGQLVRADGLGRLTTAGWQALVDHGVRTVVDLRNDDEVGDDIVARPAELTTARVPLDDQEDRELWAWLHEQKLDGSPLYFRPFMDAKPERCADAIRTIAHAQPGGVVYHCAAGRDRTGLVTTLVLSLCGVEPDEIATDYEHSNARLGPLMEAIGRPEELPTIASWLDHHGTTARQALLDAVADLDAEAYLRDAGVTTDHIAAIRARLLG